MKQFRIKMFITLFVLCVVGIVFSTIAIEKQIDSYIERIHTEVKIEVINNSDNNVTVTQNDDDITIKIDEQKEVTKTPVGEDEYILVTSDNGLNIRHKPSVDSNKVGTLNYGAKIKIVEEVGDWYKTDLGYIFKEYTIKI